MSKAWRMAAVLADRPEHVLAVDDRLAEPGQRRAGRHGTGVDPAAEQLLRNRREIVERKRALLRHSVRPVENNLGRDLPDRPRRRHGEQRVENRDRRLAREHQEWASTGIRMLDPQGSGSSACVSTAVPSDVVEPAERFIRKIGWRGMFMFEFLRDDAGVPWFVEFNGNHLLVGGKPVVEGGELRTVDAATAAREVRAARQRLADPG